MRRNTRVRYCALRELRELEVGDSAIGGSDQVFGTLNFGASSIIGRGTFLDLNGWDGFDR